MTDREFLEASYPNKTLHFRTESGAELVWFGSSLHEFEPVANVANRLRRVQRALTNGGDFAAALKG